MNKRDEDSHSTPWTEENARKAFKDGFGLPRKEMIAKPLTRVQTIGFEIGMKYFFFGFELTSKFLFLLLLKAQV